MGKLRFAKTAAVLAASVLLAASLCGCKRKEVVLDNEHIINFTAPEKDEEIVVLTVKDYGQIKIKLFPEESPKGVENFKKLVEEGFYDELIFHRVVKDFVIQTGDPKGDGTGGRDAWGGTGFDQTISGKLCHTVGAVAYAINPNERLNKSQFYIVTGKEVTDQTFTDLKNVYSMNFSPYIQRLYKKIGGQPFLDQGYEIFGQVIEGLDICQQIQNVPVNSNSKPKTQVLLQKAEIVKYDGSEIKWLDWKGEQTDGFADTADTEG